MRKQTAIARARSVIVYCGQAYGGVFNRPDKRAIAERATGRLTNYDQHARVVMGWGLERRVLRQSLPQTRSHSRVALRA